MRAEISSRTSRNADVSIARAASLQSALNDESFRDPRAHASESRSTSLALVGCSLLTFTDASLDAPRCLNAPRCLKLSFRRLVSTIQKPEELALRAGGELFYFLRRATAKPRN